MSLIEQFHAWFDAVSEPTLLLSALGNVLAGNRRVAEFTGVQNLEGGNFAAFLGSPEELKRFLDAARKEPGPIVGQLGLRDAQGAIVSCGYEASIIGHDAGGDRAVLLRLFPARPDRQTPAQPDERTPASPPTTDEAGRGWDETRLRLEDELRERVAQLAHAEARVRSVVENVIDGILTINSRGIILTVNPAAQRLFGYTPEEMIGRNVNMLMPEPYRGQHDRYLDNYLRTRQPKIIGIGREVVGRRKDGSVFPMDLGVSEFQLDGQSCFTGIVRDITERKRIENTARFLADASRSLAALVDYASTLQKVAYLAVPFFAEWCTVHVADGSGAIRQLAAAHIDPEKTVVIQELGRRYPLDAGNPAGPAHVLASGRAELTSEVSDGLIESVALTEEHRAALRRLYLQSYIGVPLAVRGKTFGVISFYSADPRRKYDSLDLAVAEDLAHRAAIAVENALLYSELRDADRRKDQFLAMLAHELRNPLAPIRSGLDLFLVGGFDAEVARMMQQQVEHLVRLVDDLLDVSRIVRGRVDLRREVVEAQTIVQRAVDSLRPSIESAAQELTVSLPTAAIRLHVDVVRIVQVVTNLLSNANKYTPRGGHIRLAVEHEGDGVVISVKDNGMGISKDILPDVFDLFAQADRSLERSQGGLGIGLTIVRTLVEMHDGSVSAQSDGEGKGSEFTVRLPIYQGAGEERPREPLVATTESRRILVVEDNVGTAKVLSRLLAKLGSHEIHMVHDGLSALEAAKQYRPEIVLLDIGLPRMNGYEVAQRLRQQPEFQETVLVALTGYGTDEDRRRSTEVGFDRHLVKPPSLEHLRQVLAHPRLKSH
jgi:PAS domain S-box-containing protein